MTSIKFFWDKPVLFFNTVSSYVIDSISSSFELTLFLPAIVSYCGIASNPRKSNLGDVKLVGNTTSSISRPQLQRNKLMPYWDGERDFADQLLICNSVFKRSISDA